MDARINITLRLSREGIAAVDKIAEVEDRSRSQMLRLLISEAVAARAKQAAR